MLNALRHQRNWNPLFPGHHGLLASAQRLTASKELELAEGLGPDSTTLGAQRLTASKELERSLGSIQTLQDYPCSTPYGIKGIGTSPPQLPFQISLGLVLNALRHQRNWNSDNAVKGVPDVH